MSAELQKSDFWSRRRAAVAAEEQEIATARTEDDVARAELELAAKSDQDILEEYKLPDPDTLEKPEDIREFLAKAPLQRLKTRALRRLWRLNPVLANLDGLLDYGEDFTDSATVIENMQTAYQVGKGMLKHIEALAEAEAAKAAEAEDEDEDELASHSEEKVVSENEATADATDVDVWQEPRAEMQDAAPALEVEDDAFVMTRPRRMTFTFEDQRI